MSLSDLENRLLDDFNKPPPTLEEFEMWLLNRAHRCEDEEDIQTHKRAWNLVREFRFSQQKGGSNGQV